jgi:hypothetical protein
MRGLLLQRRVGGDAGALKAKLESSLHSRQTLSCRGPTGKRVIAGPAQYAIP